MRRAALPLLLACACSPDDGGPGDSGGADPGDSGAGDSGPTDTGDPGSTPLEPVWTPDELSAAWSAAIADGVPAPQTVRDVYFAALAEGADAVCPGSDQLDGANALGCTSEQGWFFSGFSSWLVQDAGAGGEEWVLSGDFVIRDPDGATLEVGGHALHRLNTDTSYVSWRTDFAGWWRQEGAAGWLGDGASLMFHTDGNVDPQGDRVTIGGGASWGGLSVYFDNASRKPGDCGEHAYTGGVQVRDPSGGWWTLPLPSDCEPCGALAFAGTPYGEACLDLDTLFDGLLADLTVP